MSTLDQTTRALIHATLDFYDAASASKWTPCSSSGEAFRDALVAYRNAQQGKSAAPKADAQEDVTYQLTCLRFAEAFEKIRKHEARIIALESRPAPAVPDTVKELRAACARWAEHPDYTSGAFTRTAGDKALLRSIHADQAAAQKAAGAP